MEKTGDQIALNTFCVGFFALCLTAKSIFQFCACHSTTSECRRSARRGSCWLGIFCKNIPPKPKGSCLFQKDPIPPMTRKVWRYEDLALFVNGSCLFQKDRWIPMPVTYYFSGRSKYLGTVLQIVYKGKEDRWNARREIYEVHTF